MPLLSRIIVGCVVFSLSHGGLAESIAKEDHIGSSDGRNAALACVLSRHEMISRLSIRGREVFDAPALKQDTIVLAKQMIAKTFPGMTPSDSLGKEIFSSKDFEMHANHDFLRVKWGPDTERNGTTSSAYLFTEASYTPNRVQRLVGKQVGSFYGFVEAPGDSLPDFFQLVGIGTKCREGINVLDALSRSNITMFENGNLLAVFDAGQYTHSWTFSRDLEYALIEYTLASDGFICERIVSDNYTRVHGVLLPKTIQMQQYSHMLGPDTPFATSVAYIDSHKLASSQNDVSAFELIFPKGTIITDRRTNFTFRNREHRLVPDDFIANAELAVSAPSGTAPAQTAIRTLLVGGLVAIFLTWLLARVFFRVNVT